MFVYSLMATYALAEEPPAAAGLSATPGVPGRIPRGPRPSPGPLPTERILPVLPELVGLFPGGGLPRGGTVLLGPATTDRLPGPGVGAPGAASVLAGSQAPGLTSLLLYLLAGASSQGYWCAVAGLPALGLAAAVEVGADLSRIVLVPHPGSEGRWQSVVATLLETVDLVCLAPAALVRPTDARRLAARARERSSTLIVLDPASARNAVVRELAPGHARPGRVVARWPGPSDLRCAVSTSTWSGLGRGHGLLSSRNLEAEVGGRGAASRPRRGLLQLPA
jgi:hypothetical protein